MCRGGAWVCVYISAYCCLHLLDNGCFLQNLFRVRSGDYGAFREIYYALLSTLLLISLTILKALPLPDRAWEVLRDSTGGGGNYKHPRLYSSPSPTPTPTPSRTPE